MSSISLGAGIRSNLTSLQQTSKLLDQTQTRLSTGKKVSSAVDNPTNFFAAAGLNDRASGLKGRLDAMGQAVSTIKAADQGLTSMRGVLSAMKGVVNEALGTTSSTTRGDLGDRFNELMVQLNTFARDASYAGQNLLKDSDIGESTATNGQELTVQFNETFDDSTLTVTGFSIQGEQTAASTGMAGLQITEDVGGSTTIQATIQAYDSGGVSTAADATSTDMDGTAGMNWKHDNYKDILGEVIGTIEDFDTELKSKAGDLASNLAVVSLRQDFTTEQVNNLTEGADKLTLADLNEEGANLLALQTSQQLGINALALASQSQQAVLRLVG